MDRAAIYTLAEPFRIVRFSAGIIALSRDALVTVSEAKRAVAF
jgi:hypothetical protein